MEKKKHEKMKNSAKNSLTNKSDAGMNNKESETNCENKMNNSYSNCKHNKDTK